MFLGEKIVWDYNLGFMLRSLCSVGWPGGMAECEMEFAFGRGGSEETHPGPAAAPALSVPEQLKPAPAPLEPKPKQAPALKELRQHFDSNRSLHPHLNS